jgi:hypothetical protein
MNKEIAVKHARKIVDEGRKIGLVRDIARQMGLDPDLIADIQKHYRYKVQELDFVKREGGL